MSTPIEDFFAVIPAGGAGSRLWPLSRADTPKFLHDLAGSGTSLLRDTWDRLVPLAGPDRVAVVTGRAHRAAVKAELDGISDNVLFLESESRDSAAAIGLAAAILHNRHPDMIIGFFSADQVVHGMPMFNWAVQQAVEAARTGEIVSIGITPTEPSVGFGYIKVADAIDIPGAPEARRVERFVEKPDRETAQHYLDEGSYLWNAGILVARTGVLLEEFALHAPELYEGLMEIAAAWDDRDLRRGTVDRVYPKLPKISADYALVEPAAKRGRLAVIPGHFEWDDVGDFASLARLVLRGRTGELAVLGRNSRVLSDAASGILVSQTPRVISVVGVRDIVVVDTPDALLVTTIENAQRVKSVVDSLKLTGRDDVL